MQRHFHADLADLTQELNRQAGRVAEAVRAALEAVRDRAASQTGRIAEIENAVDEADLRIEEACLKLLALHQPVADELRFVFSAAKVNHSLERMADLAVQIARAADKLGDFRLPEVETALAELASRSGQAVLDALAAFTASNGASARALLAADDQTNRLRDTIVDRLDDALGQPGAPIRQLLRLRQIAQSLERIADHACHIAENVIYHVEGEIVRHRRQAGIPRKPLVLFLCTGNSARSQMAEALLRHLAGDRYDAQSAGTEPKPVHPLTLRVMAEIGIPLQNPQAKGVEAFLGRAWVHTVIIVCAGAARTCPTVWPGVTERLFWELPDPAAVAGTEEDRLHAFRQTRDNLQERISVWIAEQDARARMIAHQ